MKFTITVKNNTTDPSKRDVHIVDCNGRDAEKLCILVDWHNKRVRIFDSWEGQRIAYYAEMEKRRLNILTQKELSIMSIPIERIE